ncbi:hypothetical protein [Haladaptatus salinisoli]|uniref:hypothetical protein n=1 Tax=Haladaptatus salinisoli TaxID=2884876 RepID=UPI001D0BD237|nr:hypothetical protein [Haladaptatus salinisoli]
MRRRPLSLAGCVARSAPVTRREPPDDFSSSAPTPLVESEATPFAVVTVGRERSADPQPRQLWVWNDGSARTIALELTRRSKSLLGGSAESLFTDGTRYAADAIFAIEPRVPATYVLAVEVEGERETSVRVPRSRFDCNRASTAVATVRVSTRLSERTATAGCPNELFFNSRRSVISSPDAFSAIECKFLLPSSRLTNAYNRGGDKGDTD